MSTKASKTGKKNKRVANESPMPNTKSNTTLPAAVWQNETTAG
jgi:hypothetical protein